MPSPRIDNLVVPLAPQATTKKRFGEQPSPAPALSPSEALEWISTLVEQGKELGRLTLCGPGDVLATAEKTFAFVDALRLQHPLLDIRISSNGLGLVPLLGMLVEKKISQVFLQVEAVSPELLQALYAWIRPGKKTLALPEGAKILLQEQAAATQALSQAGIHVTIQTTVYPQINDQHLAQLAQTMAALGASSILLSPFQPVSEETTGPPACDPALLEQAQQAVAPYLSVVQDGSSLQPPSSNTSFAGSLLPKPSAARPNVAVASASGMEVDIHLGQAETFLIYGPREGDGLASLLTTRKAPESGTGNARWETLANQCLFDCFAVLAAKAGENPQKVLEQQGIKVLLAEESIEGLVDVLYGGGKKQKCKK
jgi:nitrogen fixation protein NifB